MICTFVNVAAMTIDATVPKMRAPNTDENKKKCNLESNVKTQKKNKRTRSGVQQLGTSVLNNHPVANKYAVHTDCRHDDQRYQSERSKTDEYQGVE